MLLYKLLPIASFACLAAAQLEPVFWARFRAYGDKGIIDNFDIKTEDCVNFKKSQPLYQTLEVAEWFVCKLYDDRDCQGGESKQVSGAHIIAQKKFKSVRCEQAYD